MSDNSIKKAATCVHNAFCFYFNSIFFFSRVRERLGITTHNKRNYMRTHFRLIVFLYCMLFFYRVFLLTKVYTKETFFWNHINWTELTRSNGNYTPYIWRQKHTWKGAHLCFSRETRGKKCTHTHTFFFLFPAVRRQLCNLSFCFFCGPNLYWFFLSVRVYTVDIFFLPFVLLWKKYWPIPTLIYIRIFYSYYYEAQHYTCK